MNDVLRQRLETFIAEQTIAEVTIDELIPLAGGASRESWIIIGTLDQEPIQLVLRRDQATSMIETALTREQEFLVIQAAYEAGIMVPRPRWYSNDLLEKPFFIMDFVEGVSIGPKVVRDPELAVARQRLPEQLAEQLAHIHMIEPPKFLPRPATDMTPARQAIQEVREMVDGLGIHNPAIEFGLWWTTQNAPESTEVVMVHGDYRIGNVLIGAEGLNAIIDWEFCHVGSLEEDLAWPCVRDWRFGNGKLHFGGISDREPFIRTYEQVSGRSVDRKIVNFWEIMGNLQWATTCLSQANRHLSGADPSIEYASLGRRSVEMQFEMLRLIHQWRD